MSFDYDSWILKDLPDDDEPKPKRSYHYDDCDQDDNHSVAMNDDCDYWKNVMRNH